MSGDAGRPPVEEMSFEDALAALEDVVGRLEDAKVPLEESIALYQRGDALRARCETLLREAELRVQKIVAGPDGAAGAEDSDLAPDKVQAAPAKGGKSAPRAPAPQAKTDEDDDIPF